MTQGCPGQGTPAPLPSAGPAGGTAFGSAQPAGVGGPAGAGAPLFASLGGMTPTGWASAGVMPGPVPGGWASGAAACPQSRQPPAGLAPDRPLPPLDPQPAPEVPFSSLAGGVTTPGQVLSPMPGCAGGSMGPQGGVALHARGFPTTGPGSYPTGPTMPGCAGGGMGPQGGVALHTRGVGREERPGPTPAGAGVGFPPAAGYPPASAGPAGSHAAPYWAAGIVAAYGPPTAIPVDPPVTSGHPRGPQWATKSPAGNPWLPRTVSDSPELHPMPPAGGGGAGGRGGGPGYAPSPSCGWPGSGAGRAGGGFASARTVGAGGESSNACGEPSPSFSTGVA